MKYSTHMSTYNTCMDQGLIMKLTPMNHHAAHVEAFLLPQLYPLPDY